MKPIVVKANDDGLIVFNEKELNDLVDKVYKAGFEDGKSKSGMVMPYYDTQTVKRVKLDCNGDSEKELLF